MEDYVGLGNNTSQQYDNGMTLNFSWARCKWFVVSKNVEHSSLKKIAEVLALNFS